MYAVSPRVAAAWRTLLLWVIGRTGVACDVVAHPPPQPLAAVWSRPDLGCAFMCGWPFAQSDPQPRLIAAPVPSPVRYGGRPVYFTDLVVRATADFRTLDDTFGFRLGYTVEDSQSGYNAPRHHLRGVRPGELPEGCDVQPAAAEVHVPAAARGRQLDGHHPAHRQG
jgi:hypothetical protein